MALETFIILTILVALAFDFINGFHDSANAIATVVATRVLSPLKAVLMAGFFNFVGPFLFSLAVANAVGKGIIEQAAATKFVILAALIGAIVWDLITWWAGLPTSSSHALVGGLVGAALAASFDASSILLPTRDELGLGFAGGALYVGIVWEYLAYGALGGLLVGLFMVPWSRLNLSRPYLGLFILLGVTGLGYFSYAHSVYPAPSTFVDGPLDFVRDLLKPLLVNFVYVLMGLLLGGLLWAGSKQRSHWKDAAYFVLPGAAFTLAVATLLQKAPMGALTKTIVFMFVSPILGFSMGFITSAMTQWMWRNTSADLVNRTSRRLQLGSSAFYALTHGTNDAQKTMGIIGVLLLGAGEIGLHPDKTLALPAWVIVASATAMGLGTAFGGWRIVQTMAARITHLTPPQGFAAETGGGVVLVAMAESGIPVSTTHAISSSIMGVGATRRLSAVRWGVGRQMFIAWILTIPAAAVVAALSYWAIAALT